jgi:hypothetical protein
VAGQLAVGALDHSHVLTLWGYGDAVADSLKLAERARDKLHAERPAAIEKGVPPPDPAFDEALLAFLADGGAGMDAGASRHPARALGWGILLITAGLGWYLACVLTDAVSPVGWVYHTRMFGIVPALLGFGVLLHVQLTRARD